MARSLAWLSYALIRPRMGQLDRGETGLPKDELEQSSEYRPFRAFAEKNHSPRIVAQV